MEQLLFVTILDCNLAHHEGSDILAALLPKLDYNTFTSVKLDPRALLESSHIIIAYPSIDLLIYLDSGPY